MSVGEICGFVLWAVLVGLVHWWGSMDPRRVMDRRQRKADRRQDRADLRRIRAAQRRAA